MTRTKLPAVAAARQTRLGRRAALLAPLAALGGCSVFDDLFGATKTPLPGRREGVMIAHQGLQVATETPPRVTLPAAVGNGEWPQAGGNLKHVLGRIEGPSRLSRAWSVAIGEGGGYRRKITSEPVVAQGHVFSMDSDGLVSAFDVRSGARSWEFDTQAQKDRSANVGGGIGFDSGVLYASTGRAELLALQAGDGKLKWRRDLGAPARSAPTIAEGRIFVTTISQQLVALGVEDGTRIWSFQASLAETTVLGEPAPAYADGLVVAGFGSGDLAALRAASGGVAWTDSIASAAGRTSMADLSAITGMPVIVGQSVYAIGLGGLLVAIDLRAGRRLWEHEVAGSQTPWVAGDWLFLLTVDQQIAAISTLDGTVSWVAELPRYENVEKQRDPIQWKGPLLVGEHLIVAGTNAKVRMLSPYTGESQGVSDLPGPASLAPIMAGGMMFVLTDDGSLTAFR
jgi:outer membrane protein assembly factor BamB